MNGGALRVLFLACRGFGVEVKFYTIDSLIQKQKTKSTHKILQAKASAKVSNLLIIDSNPKQKITQNLCRLKPAPRGQNMKSFYF